MTRAALCALLLLAPAVDGKESAANARVVFEVRRAGAGPTRAELWMSAERAHLRAPDVDTYWDLVGERRVELHGGQSRDVPIVFARAVAREELFPRGLKLKRLGHGRVLGRTCQMWRHQQDAATADAMVKSRMTWCVWKGVPLSLEIVESVCPYGSRKCTPRRAHWSAVELALGAAKDSDLTRPKR